MKFSKVQPSSSGEMSTAQDTLTVNTNCTVGYSVYVSAINGGDTNLTNDSASASGNNTIAPSSATVGGTATVLSANTWGINGSSSEVEDGKYFGLPAYASATASALTTRSNVAEQTTVPIYYGAKVTTAIAPGSYAGDVLYTVLPDTSCLDYIVAFDKNASDATGTMENQSIPTGTATDLSANAYSRDGYTFLGWSNSADGKTGTAVNGVGTMADVDYTDKEKVTDLITGGQTKTLYAIWAVLSGDMQTWTGCPSLAANSIAYLNDSRDNTVYAVKKLPDGKCWMIENLTISATNLQVAALNNTNTNIPSSDSGSYYLPPQNQRANTTDINSSSVASGGQALNFASGYDNYPQIGYRAAGSTDNQTGNPVPENTAYYPYYTATLGFSYNGDGKTSGSSPRDICPKGWRLPWTSDAGQTKQGNAEFYTLALAYNNDSSVWTNYIAPGSTGSSSPQTINATVRNNMISGDSDSIDRFGNNGAAGFTYAGAYNSTTLYNVGTVGRYWSSSVYSTTDSSYQLRFNTTSVIPQDNGIKNNGLAVRCVAQNNYTVSYNANGGTGAASKESDSFYETGEVTTANQGTLNRDGYNFLGWSLDANATTATYSANTAVSVPSLISAAGTPASGSTITLYAVWEKAIEAMQGWTGCASLSVGQSIDLKDTRDNKVYAIKKLPDGKCWMVQNLTLGSEGSTAAQRTLTSANTNIDNGTTYYLPPAGKQGSITSSSTLTSTTAASFSSSNDNQAKTQFRTKGSSITNDSDTGYYNFYTATLGYSYYQTSGSGAGISQGSSTRDICPKGWRLPKTTDAGATVSATTSVNDFTHLARQYSTSGWKGTSTSSNYYINDANSVVHTGLHTGVAANGNNYAGFSYAGNWDGTNTSAGYVGSFGFYWSSSVYAAYGGYYLNFNSSDVYPQGNNRKYYGLAVRCVAKETMQEFKSSELTSVGDSKTLIDARDGKEYTVKKLPDGKVWMMQNLTIGSDGAKILTSADTNIDNNTTYYLPPAGKQGDITSSSTLTSTTAANFGSSNDNQAKTKFRTKNSGMTNDSDTGYYNFYTATLGFSYQSDGKTSGSSTRDICPKGWRLPKTTDAGTTVSAITSVNDFTYLTRQYSTADWSGTATNWDYGTTNSTALTGIHTGVAANGNNYAGFSYAGYWDGTNTSASSVGICGSYWSSSVYNTNSGYILNFYSSIVYPQSNYFKYGGLAVRCIAKS